MIRPVPLLHGDTGKVMVSDTSEVAATTTNDPRVGAAGRERGREEDGEVASSLQLAHCSRVDSSAAKESAKERGVAANRTGEQDAVVNR
jgi:hypothetical protein